MNRIPATLTGIAAFEGVSQLFFDADGTLLTMVGLELPRGARTGVEVILGVKATHIVPAREIPKSAAISNALPVSVEAIEKGRILSVVTFRFGGLPLEAIVPANTLETLGMYEGEKGYALFQASELSILEVLS
ncbi:TOBE domain-containing protein [Hydrogenimonas sp.]|uniref:TOBE domain-containing protein n=1 Tax=Hydrogenimonas sp. TaxID=2231112 RepID=UPI0026068B4D|nr:TOBE domain-containing protein [Hydrogenimonas sp.]